VATEVVIGLITFAGTQFALIGVVVRYFLGKDKEEAKNVTVYQKAHTDALVKVAEAILKQAEIQKEASKTQTYLYESLKFYAKENSHLIALFDEFKKTNAETIEYMKMSHNKNQEVYEFLKRLNGRLPQVVKEKIEQADKERK